MTATAVSFSPARDDTPGRDGVVEAWLDSLDVDWEFAPSLALAGIDMKRSLANQARLDDEPLIPDVVERYQVAYETGTVFPPVLVRRDGQRLVILDGLHRATGATNAGVSHHAAYVVACADTTAVRLMYEGNAKHGQPLTKRQRMAQAVHLVELGWSAVEAGRALGLRESDVSNARLLQRAQHRARDAGALGWTGLGQAVQIELARIPADRDTVFVEAVKLASDAGLSGAQARETIRPVRDARSEVEALRLLGAAADTFNDRLEAPARRHGGGAGRGGGGGVQSTAYGRAKNTVTGLHALGRLKAADVAASCPTDEARAVLRQQLRDAAMACMNLCRGLE